MDISQLKKKIEYSSSDPVQEDSLETFARVYSMDESRRALAEAINVVRRCSPGPNLVLDHWCTIRPMFCAVTCVPNTVSRSPVWRITNYRRSTIFIPLVQMRIATFAAVYFKLVHRSNKNLDLAVQSALSKRMSDASYCCQLIIYWVFSQRSSFRQRSPPESSRAPRRPRGTLRRRRRARSRRKLRTPRTAAIACASKSFRGESCCISRTLKRGTIWAIAGGGPRAV